MDNAIPGTSKECTPERSSTLKTRSTRGRKRKRIISESSSDIEDVLPENTLEVEKNLHASAVKNNLDDVSVKKILKKVVTNDHVLALVKLREEEEQKAEKAENVQPKLTRAKVKELMKVSPRAAPWNLENLELTPIKHIPVKTRPEVKALITQELQDDEDDDEYEPTNDDVPSDDDHTLESCSDVDSQPRTPATPRRFASPRNVKDGPFKVPQEISTPRRRLQLDEDATIALRTRSKLSLSSIPIDHIESSFVPPDELPMPAMDDIWTEFLQECMNPEASKNEDDDDDPEYNVAADPDAHDEDEEGLENIMKISKKELNDLVTELFNIMPETTADDLTDKLASDITIQNNNTEQQPNFPQPIPIVSKREPMSDEETQPSTTITARDKRTSVGKMEPASDTECQEDTNERDGAAKTPPRPIVRIQHMQTPKAVTVSVIEGSVAAYPQPEKGDPPPTPLQNLLVAQNTLTVQVQQGTKILPEQIAILQQQLRQHVQIATTNFLQLYVHPVHWELAPKYREYLETLVKITKDNPDSVANVCNLQPALALINSWQESVSTDTPENARMVEFIQSQVERARRRAAQNNLYVGDFHETFMNVVANSSVFLYPHLLPPIPYRCDGHRRIGYLRSEDELIALGVDQFWQYVEDNKELYKVPARPSAAHRWGLVATVALVAKHMFPWLQPKGLLGHIQSARKFKDTGNPIVKFFASREVTPVQHTLLPFNPNLTLYEQPEHEMPRAWVRHLAKSSERFRYFQTHHYRRSIPSKCNSSTPRGVPVELGAAVQPPKKNPLPISFTKEIKSNRNDVLPVIAPKPKQDKFDIELTPPCSTTTIVPALYSVVQTPSGAYLVPVSMVTTDSASTPICSSKEQETVASNPPEESNVPSIPTEASREHCECCDLLRKITKERQALITDYFKPKVKICPCKQKMKKKYPKVSKKLILLVNCYKSKAFCAWQGLQCRLQSLTREIKKGLNCDLSEAVGYELDEIAAVTSFQLKLTTRTTIARNVKMKKRVHTLLSRFNLDQDDPYVLMENLEKAFAVECVDVYKEFLGFLTMEQADRMGKFMDYFKQECLTDLMKKIEELVPNKRHKLNMLTKLRNVLTNPKSSTCDVCTQLLGVTKYYPKLAAYVFDLFPHRRDTNVDPKTVTATPVAPQPQERELETQGEDAEAIDNENSAEYQDSQTTENAENEDDEDSQAIDNTANVEFEDSQAIDNTANVDYENSQAIDNLENAGGDDSQAVDNVENSGGENSNVIDNTENEEGEIAQRKDSQAVDNVDSENDEMSIDENRKEAETTIDKTQSEFDDSRAMDYEADHSESDDERSEDNLTIIENPDEINNTGIHNNIKMEDDDTSDDVVDTPFLTITKTEVQEYTDSEASMVITLEDVTVKSEPQEWKRDEDKLLLEVLQQSLTPEERQEINILEIIEEKNVLEVASHSLVHKSLDDIKARIMYLLEFLVFNRN